MCSTFWMHNGSVGVENDKVYVIWQTVKPADNTFEVHEIFHGMGRKK